jgi:periplasmic protein TonB
VIDDFSAPRLRSLIYSLAIHGAVVIFLVYRAFDSVALLTPQQQAINVALVAPEVQPTPAKSVITPTEQAKLTQPEPLPEPVSTEKLAAPVQDSAPIALPQPTKSQPQPTKATTNRKPVKVAKRSEPEKPKRKPLIPDVTRTEAENPFRPLSDSQQQQPQTAPKTSPSNADAVLEGKPVRTRTVQPLYPERALALQQEGRVEVSFDVTAAGNVENIRIISAQPRNMFEQAVKMALRRWHYQPGRTGNNQRVVIQFKLNDGASID